MEPTEAQQNTVNSRAKEIDTGAVPLPMSNVLLGLPYKPDPTAIINAGSAARSWTYADFFQQKQLLTDIKIDTSSKNKVWEFGNKWENVLMNIYGNENLRRLYGLKSWNLNFCFEFRSNFQQVGQFCLFYSNLPANMINYHFRNISSQRAYDPFTDYTIQTQLPHRKIPMGEDVNLDIQLKWNSPHSASFGLDMYSTAPVDDPSTISFPFYDFGTLYLYVPFPMEVSTGVISTMSVRVWIYLSDLAYSAYRPVDEAL